MAKKPIKKSPLAEVLDDWYGDRVWFRLLRSPTLSVAGRLVVSALLRREQNGLRSNPFALRRETGLDRNETIPAALRELRDEYGVVDWDEKGKGLIKTKEPDNLEGRFYLREGSDNTAWFDRVAYDRYYVLAEKSVLNIADNVILWTLVGRSADGYVVTGQNREGLAAMTHYSIKHVGRVVSKLVTWGFIDQLSARSWGLNPPNAVRLAMFRQLPPVTPDSEASAIADHVRRVKALTLSSAPGPDERRQAVLRAIDGRELTAQVCDLLDALDRRGFTPDEIRFVLDVREALGHAETITVFNQASRQHKRKHGEDAADCFALFRYKVNRLLGRR